ncbi:MAG: ketoacyl-ACP synthase III [Bryobacteraceae bacterium]|jgi:3-oxoacyl-[acyl-carrier-protein] synthase-3
MPFIAGFGSYLPAKIVDNSQLAEMLGCTAEWIKEASGIEERRYAAGDESVDVLAANAGSRCLERAGVSPDRVDLLIVSSGSGELRFPGPASMVAKRLELRDVPALDLPIASAGALFGMSLASRLTPQYATILVIAAEKMSTVVMQEPVEKNTAILFGDGAGACLIRRDSGDLEIVDSILHSDGSFVNDLQLGFGRPLQMNGRSVIMQATRKIPGVILELLQRNKKTPAEIERFIMHQANQNLIDRAAKSLDVPHDRFYSNIRNFGNTSSASMLIAATEWWRDRGAMPAGSICFVVFGAGFHWGALLAQSTTLR